MNKKVFFSDYKDDASNWITLATGEYYPDILKNACGVRLYNVYARAKNVLKMK